MDDSPETPSKTVQQEQVTTTTPLQTLPFKQLWIATENSNSLKSVLQARTPGSQQAFPVETGMEQEQCQARRNDQKNGITKA